MILTTMMDSDRLVCSVELVEKRERQWEYLFQKLTEVNEQATDFSLDCIDFQSSGSCDRTFDDEEFVFSGDEDPKCFYYKIHDDDAAASPAKPLQFDHTLEHCYRLNNCYLLKEFKDMMQSISKQDNCRIRMLVHSYMRKAQVQLAIDHLEYYCSRLYFILFYDIWLKKTHADERVQQCHQKFTTNLLGELRSEVKDRTHFLEYFKHVHFAYTVTEKIVDKRKRQRDRRKK